MESENKGLIDVRDCPCDGCPAKPCGHPARCVKFTLWLNKTVDAVPVVRCKDCKHWDIQENCDPGFMYFCNADALYAWGRPARNADDFCSYGERKDYE